MSDIFEHVEEHGKIPVVLLPLPDGKMIDVWTFLAALYEVVDGEDMQSASDMIQWLGTIIFEAMDAVPMPEKPNQKTIAQIFRKETENFDEKFEKFLKSLEGETDGKAD
jgi:hypothetical protein